MPRIAVTMGYVYVVGTLVLPTQRTDLEVPSKIGITVAVMPANAILHRELPLRTEHGHRIIFRIPISHRGYS